MELAKIVVDIIQNNKDIDEGVFNVISQVMQGFREAPFCHELFNTRLDGLRLFELASRAIESELKIVESKCLLLAFESNEHAFIISLFSVRCDVSKQVI